MDALLSDENFRRIASSMRRRGQPGLVNAFEVERAARLAAEAKIVYGFYEEETPLFSQGRDGGCELASPVTAEECKGYVDKIAELEDKLAAAKANLRVAENELRFTRLRVELERQSNGARLARVNAAEAENKLLREVIDLVVSSAREAVERATNRLDRTEARTWGHVKPSYLESARNDLQRVVDDLSNAIKKSV